MPPITLSVLMPVYNASQYINDAINSILCQSFSDFEFLILDDGSDDCSLEIVKHAASLDRRVRFYTGRHRGLCQSLNLGIQLAQGQFLARMDADDIARPNRFEKQLTYLVKNPSVVALGSRVLVVDHKGRPLRETHPPLDHDGILEKHLDPTSATVICHPTLMCRRSSICQIGGYREKFNLAEDRDLYLRLSKIGHLANHGEILLEYRRHLKAVSVEKRASQYRLLIEVVKTARHQYGMSDIDIENYEQLNSLSSSDMRLNNISSALLNGYLTSAVGNILEGLRTGDLNFFESRVRRQVMQIIKLWLKDLHKKYKLNL